MTAKGHQFRLLTQMAGEESIEVYDGRTLYSKMLYHPVNPSGATLPPEALASAGTESRPIESARTVSLAETDSKRFWSNADAPGHGEAGGTIAGRETVFHKVMERRPDGELSKQEWLDAKTGVLLKSIFSIYSSQVNSMVTQDTWECQSIDYGPVDDSAFLKP